MKFQKVLKILPIVLIIAGCSNSRFELPNSIVESEDFIFYFDSDSTYKMVEKSKIGGIVGSLFLTDTSVYLNPNSEDEIVFNYIKKNDSVEFFNSDTTINFLLKTTSDEQLFAFERQFNEHKRLGIPPAVFSTNDFDGLDSDEAKNIISKIWKNSLAYYKYPETVRASIFNIEKRTPSNEFERKWNAEDLYDDYSFILGAYAQNALKQEDYSSMYGYVIMNNSKMEKLIFPKYEEVDEQYEWRSYSTPDDFSEADIKEVNSILKNKYKIDVDNNVEELQIYEPTSNEEGYSMYVTTIKEVWQPYGYISGGYMTKIHSFKLTRTDGKINISRD